VSSRAAQVRIYIDYIDADILGLGKVLGSLRGDDLSGWSWRDDPQAAAAAVPVTSPAVLDPGWIPVVAARGWLIVARDSKIIENLNEIAAVRESNAKMVALNQRDAETKWGQLEVFMAQWRRIEALIPEPGPFIWRASRTAMTPISLG